jgi:hypothetical protein
MFDHSRGRKIKNDIYCTASLGIIKRAIPRTLVNSIFFSRIAGFLISDHLSGSLDASRGTTDGNFNFLGFEGSKLNLEAFRENHVHCLH